MKNIKKGIVTVVLIAVALGSFTSCATTMKVNTEESVSGYTLKNKKELMQQKIVHKKAKTVLATP
ncbi:MAG: hypothetical protein KTR22_14845 [Flavobacteriaceae bacterium]|nr:hypothetical protein [Flavobacteriaceae bacterium]